MNQRITIPEPTMYGADGRPITEKKEDPRAWLEDFPAGRRYALNGRWFRVAEIQKFDDAMVLMHEGLTNQEKKRRGIK